MKERKALEKLAIDYLVNNPFDYEHYFLRQSFLNTGYYESISVIEFDSLDNIKYGSHKKYLYD